MTHFFENSFELPLSLDAVFDFFSAADNLEKITPPEMHFRLLTPLPIKMEVGTVIDYRLKIMKLPLRWRSRISRWAPPYVFADEQVRGPYALWIHTHAFEDTHRGTRIRDAVVYSLPLGPLGEMGHTFVRRQLTKIFAYREHAIRDALLPDPSTPPARTRD
jgi:ligand-binding SRPBCC domain-containing protein